LFGSGEPTPSFVDDQINAGQGRQVCELCKPGLARQQLNEDRIEFYSCDLLAPEKSCG
jgi:hypothetical protein